MDRRKTTVYLDPDVLTATKVVAAARQQSESRVVEDALRAYLGDGPLEAAGADLRALMDRVAKHEALDDEEAMAVAVSEVRAVRTARSIRHTAYVTAPRAVADTNVLVAAAISPPGYLRTFGSLLPSTSDGSQ